MAANVLPLQGVRVLVTRPAHQAEALSKRLRALGAVPLELPVIEIAPLDEAALDQALGDLHGYDWVVFTSVNTVLTVGVRFAELQCRPQVAVIGVSTASACADMSITVDLIPEQFVAESVLEALLERDVSGKRILLPRAEVARDTLPEGLRAAGAHVDVVPVYQTLLPENLDAGTVEQVLAGELDVITFTSPSTVRNLLEILEHQYPPGVRTACIGPVTARAAEDAGLKVDIIASEYSVPGLVQALVEGMNR